MPHGSASDTTLKHDRSASMTRELLNRYACWVPLIAALGLSACAPEDLTTGPNSNNPPNNMNNQKTQFEEVASFLSTNCAMAGCHNGSSAFVPRIEGGTSATPAQVQAALEGITSGAGAPLVAPNDSANSVIWRRLIGNPSFMPPGPGLAMDKIQIVQTWIDAGAKYEISAGTPDMGEQDMKMPDMGDTDMPAADMDGGNVSPEFAEVVRIMRGCALAGCHDASSFALPKIEGGTMATPAQVTAALQDVASVTPNTSLVDMIYLRISGTGGGNRMPLGREPLPQAEIDAYKAWLDAGANFK